MFVSNFRARASVLAAASAALFVGCSADSPEQQTRFEPPPPASAAPGGSLLGAVRSGRIDAVRDLLGQGADVNASAADGTTALIEAVGARQSEIADLLLEAGADPNAVNRYGMSALHLAARDADASSVEVLLAAGADPSVALPEGETVLMAAAKSGDPAILRALLESGSIADGASYGSATRVVNAPDPNAREGWYGQTALMWAAAGGHAEAMRLLIEAGAEVDQASSRIAAPEIEPERRQGGFVYASIPEGRLTALHFAAREGQLDAVRTLIDAGANLDLGDSYGTTPLVLATLNGHLGVAAALLEAGADPNIQDQYGRTALFVATDLNTIDVNPRPPPPITGDYRPVDIVQMALEHGADVDLTLSEKGLPAWVAQGGAHNPMLADGATAFFRAAMSGDLEIMNLLLEAGADPLVVTAEQPVPAVDLYGARWTDDRVHGGSRRRLAARHQPRPRGRRDRGPRDASRARCGHQRQEPDRKHGAARRGNAAIGHDHRVSGRPWRRPGRDQRQGMDAARYRARATRLQDSGQR
jgi:ankyrin repeat protein